MCLVACLGSLFFLTLLVLLSVHIVYGILFCRCFCNGRLSGYLQFYMGAFPICMCTLFFYQEYGGSFLYHYFAYIYGVWLSLFLLWSFFGVVSLIFPISNHEYDGYYYIGLFWVSLICLDCMFILYSPLGSLFMLPF
jgi:hypothetical protein